MKKKKMNEKAGVAATIDLVLDLLFF